MGVINTIILRAGDGTPSQSDLADGEVVVDTTNYKLFMRDANNGTQIQEIGGGSGDITNVIAGTNQAKLLWNASIDGGSNYNVAKTSAVYYAYQYQSNSDYGVAADTAGNLGSQNSTANIMIYQRLANYGDVGLCGYLYLATPSNTTYNKHWYSRLHSTDSGPAGSYNNSNTWYINGRLHTTSAIDAVQFQISTGTFSGTIKLYGIA